MNKLAIFIILSAVISVQELYADVVIWDYSLTELPEDWESQIPWEFSSEGMNYYYFCLGRLDSSGNVYTSYFDIPTDTDSLTLTVEAIYEACNWEGSHEAEIYYRTNRIGSTWDRVWIASAPVNWEGTISITITESSSATAGMFRFRGNAAAGTSSAYAVLNWTLFDLVLTAHVNPLAFDGVTWASIKTSF